MSLEQYRVPVTNDFFEFDNSIPGLSFPCVACAHRHKDQYADPCGMCGHNLNSKVDAQPEGGE